METAGYYSVMEASAQASRNRFADAFIQADYEILASVNTSKPPPAQPNVDYKVGEETKFTDPHRQSKDIESPAFWAVYVTDALKQPPEYQKEGILGVTHESFTSSYIFGPFPTLIVPPWQEGLQYGQGFVVSFNDKAYVRSKAGLGLQNPEIDTTNWKLKGELWESGVEYDQGEWVLTPDSRMYMRRGTGAGTTDPRWDPANWLAAGDVGVGRSTVHEIGHQLLKDDDHFGSKELAQAMAVNPASYQLYDEGILGRVGGVMSAVPNQVADNYFRFIAVNIKKIRELTMTTK